MDLTLVLQLVISIFYGTTAIAEGGEMHSFHEDAFAHQEEISVMPYITPSAGQTCTFQLSYQGMIFNHNGTFVLSERYHYSHRRRTNLQAYSLLDYLLLVLTIENTRPEDAGRYRCSFECTRTQSYQEHRLHVYYPPAPAKCSWAHENTHLPVRPLKCSAMNGFPSGHIICYITENNNSKAYSPLQESAGEFLEASFWFPKKAYISCCSINDESTKSAKTCTDFEYPLPVSTSTKSAMTSSSEGHSSTSFTLKGTKKYNVPAETSRTPTWQSPPHGSGNVVHGNCLSVIALHSLFFRFLLHK